MLSVSAIVVITLFSNILFLGGTTVANVTPVPGSAPTRQPRPRKQRRTTNPAMSSPSARPLASTHKPTHRRRPGQPSRAPKVKTKSPFTPTPSTTTPDSAPISPIESSTKSEVPISQTSKPTHRRRPGQPTRSPREAPGNSTAAPSTAAPTKIYSTAAPTKIYSTAAPTAQQTTATPTAPKTTAAPIPIAPIPPTSKPSSFQQDSQPVGSVPSVCNICGPGLVIGNPGGEVTSLGNCSQYQKLGNQGGIPPRLCSGFPALAEIPCNCTAAPSS